MISEENVSPQRCAVGTLLLTGSRFALGRKAWHGVKVAMPIHSACDPVVFMPKVGGDNEYTLCCSLLSELDGVFSVIEAEHGRGG